MRFKATVEGYAGDKTYTDWKVFNKTMETFMKESDGKPVRFSLSDYDPKWKATKK